MKASQVKEMIQSNEWWLEEAPGVFQVFHYIMQTFVNSHKILGKRIYDFALSSYKDGVAFEITPIKGKIAQFEFLLENLKKDETYLDTLLVEHDKIKARLQQLSEELFNTELASLTDTSLLEKYSSLHELLSTWLYYGTFWECVDPVSERFAVEMKKKYGLAEGIVMQLLSPVRQSFLIQESIDFNDLCRGKMPIETYHSKYYWIDSNFVAAKERTIEVIKKKMQEEKGHQEIHTNDEIQILKKKHFVSIENDDRMTFELISRIAELIDIRKEHLMRGTHWKHMLIEEMARKKGIALDDFMLFTEEEAMTHFQGEEADMESIKKRKKPIFVYTTPEEEKIYTGEEADVLYTTFLETLKGRELVGNVSYDPGKSVKGEVCKVINVQKEEFAPGSILVTSMTRPEFMPIMKKAKAVITDEGGLTCHAAIVSRELKIPCIVGTKAATKQLETGDAIEMDFSTGRIRKLK